MDALLQLIGRARISRSRLRPNGGPARRNSSQASRSSSVDRSSKPAISASISLSTGFRARFIPVAPSTGNERRPASVLGEPTHRGLRTSCARRLSDAVDPAALLLARSKGEPEPLLQSAREDAAHGVLVFAAASFLAE